MGIISQTEIETFLNLFRQSLVVFLLVRSLAQLQDLNGFLQTLKHDEILQPCRTSVSAL